MTNKTIYLGITYNCSACKCQENLLKEAFKDYPYINIKICNYKELPSWLQSQVILTDFPITIFVENEVIKYHLIGTASIRKLRDIAKNINF